MGKSKILRETQAKNAISAVLTMSKSPYAGRIFSLEDLSTLPVGSTILSLQNVGEPAKWIVLTAVI